VSSSKINCGGRGDNRKNIHTIISDRVKYNRVLTTLKSEHEAPLADEGTERTPDLMDLTGERGKHSIQQMVIAEIAIVND